MRSRVVSFGFIVTLFAVHAACSESQGFVPTSPTQTTAGTSAPTPATAGMLVVESFTVVEFRYPASSGWFYTPLVRVSSPENSGSVVVTQLSLDIPGLGPAPPACGSKAVGTGETVDLVREIYGDYELSFDRGEVRASGDSATVTIAFKDALGAARSLTARGPIVSGTLPATYSGGTGSWSSCLR